jgi:hypothetical protein
LNNLLIGEKKSGKWEYKKNIDNIKDNVEIIFELFRERESKVKLIKL